MYIKNFITIPPPQLSPQQPYVHTTIFKMDNRQGPTIQPRELGSMFCTSLDGRGVWQRMNPCKYTRLSALAAHPKLSQHC